MAKTSSNEVELQQIAEQMDKQGAQGYAELCDKIAGLTEDKLEKFTYLAQGFLAGASCGK